MQAANQYTSGKGNSRGQLSSLFKGRKEEMSDQQVLSKQEEKKIKNVLLFHWSS